MRSGQMDRDRSDMRPTSKMLNFLLEKILRFETLVMRKNNIMGLTVMALCRKK
jgi:hypothetical protein